MTTEPVASPRPRYRRILCPIDFSEPSRQALLLAADQAHQFGATLELLHVYPAPKERVDPAATVQLLAQFDRALSEWKGWAQALGAAEVVTSSVQGDAPSEIVARASEGDFDLLLMGTHGRGGVGHLLLGSVTEKVLRTAPCDVLTVRAAPPSSGASPGAPVSAR